MSGRRQRCFIYSPLVLCTGFAWLIVGVESTCPISFNRPTCHCSATTINCMNSKFPNDMVLKNSIPLSVVSLTFTGNNLKELRPNLIGSCDASNNRPQHKKLTYLRLSNNNITLIHGKTFHCMPNLDTLILDDNDWEVDNHAYVFSNLPKLRLLSLRNAFNETNSTAKYLDKFSQILGSSGISDLEVLHLENNEIYALTKAGVDSLCTVPKLKKLYLNSNYLRSLELNGTCLKELEQLHLYNNSIPYLSDTFMETIDSLPKLSVVNLSENPYRCDCRAKNFFKWLNQTKKVPNKKLLGCAHGPLKNIGKTILSLTESDFVCPEPGSLDKKIEASYIVMGVIFGAIGLLFVIVTFMNRKEILSHCIRLGGNCKDHFNHISPGRQFGYSSVGVPT